MEAWRNLTEMVTVKRKKRVRLGFICPVLTDSHQQKCMFPFCCCSLLSRVQLFVTPWTAADQAFLSFIISRSLLKPKPTSSRYLSRLFPSCSGRQCFVVQRSLGARENPSSRGQCDLELIALWFRFFLCEAGETAPICHHWVNSAESRGQSSGDRFESTLPFSAPRLDSPCSHVGHGWGLFGMRFLLSFLSAVIGLIFSIVMGILCFME